MKSLFSSIKLSYEGYSGSKANEIVVQKDHDVQKVIDKYISTLLVMLN